jgi:hypothetical protein
MRKFRQFVVTSICEIEVFTDLNRTSACPGGFLHKAGQRQRVVWAEVVCPHRPAKSVAADADLHGNS